MALAEVLLFDENVSGDVAAEVADEAEVTELKVVQGELVKDTTKLTRQEVLEEFMVPRETYEGEPSPEEVTRLGNIEMASINPMSSLIMPQIRDTYNLDHFLRLGFHICESEDGQLQNCGVAVHTTKKSALKYLADANEYFESDVQLGEATWNEVLGGYVITMFGHNRQLGVAAYNLHKTGHPNHGHQFVAKVVRNPEFWRALEMQAVENTGLHPKMWDRSRAIVRYKQLRTRDGVPPTQQEIAEKFGVNTDQVWRAERFEALPKSLKAFSVDERLPYSGVVEMDGLIGLYSEEQLVELAKRWAVKNLSAKQIEAEVKKRKVVIDLGPLVFALVDEEKLTLPHVNSLKSMQEIGMPQIEIDEVANWIVLTKPKQSEVDAGVKKRIKQFLKGMPSMFDEEDPTDTYEEIQARKDRLRAQGQAHNIKTGTEKAMEFLGAIRDAYENGLIPQEGAKMLPATEAVRAQYGDIIDKINKGVRVDVEPEVLELILEVLELEEEAAKGIIRDERRKEATKKIAELLERQRSPYEQGSMLDVMPA